MVEIVMHGQRCSWRFFWDMALCCWTSSCRLIERS